MAATPNNEPPLIQPLNLTQLPPPPAAPPPPRVEDAPATARAAKSEDAQRSQNQSKPESPTKATASEKDPMRELLDRMERLAPMVVSIDPALARTLRGLSQRGADPDQRAQPGFRNDVAYALQDLEKSPVGRLEIPPLLRNEMMQLAGTAVGLTNERMQALIAATASIQDRLLVADIRAAGKEIGLRVDQSHPEVDGRIATLENRARLTARPAEPEVAARTPGVPNPAGGDRPPNGVREGPGSGLGGLPNGAPPNGNLNGGSYQNRNTSHAEVTIQHSVLDTLLRAMRPDARQAQPPWEPPATPVADRLAASELRTQMNADDKAFASAEKRGKAALDALQAFTNGEGAAVMSKIREAAKTEPGGMPQVLSEMREGGRFADLRKQFSNALADDTGFAAAYEKAAGALASYGKTRSDVEPILARRPDAAAFTQRLGELDAEIGKAAASTPSKTEGRSMIDDLTKQAAELLQRAVETVKAAFSKSASPSVSSSPSPSP